MSLKLGQGAHSTATFIATHALAYAPDAVPDPVPAGGFVVNDGFFTVKTVEELQKIVDTTWKMRKKLLFSGNAVTAAAAKAVLADASSESATKVTVRWGIHQSQDRPQGVVGKSTHFTVKGTPTDWHLYVNTDGSRVAFMSNGPANYVAIKKP
jgi:hypothetical protein